MLFNEGLIRHKWQSTTLGPQFSLVPLSDHPPVCFWNQLHVKFPKETI